MHPGWRSPTLLLLPAIAGASLYVACTGPKFMAMLAWALSTIPLALLHHQALSTEPACRGRIELQDLQPGQELDTWLDIRVPQHGDAQKREKHRGRDKLASMLLGTKGARPQDVADCRVHLKVALTQCFAY